MLNLFPIFTAISLDNLLLRGIEPFVTIHHHDLPRELEERYGGWLSPLIKRDFVHLAKICFESFGDRVKYWTTINEPNLFIEMAYVRGVYPPGHCSAPFGNCSVGNSDAEPLIAMHNALLSHAIAVHLYRNHFQAKQGGTIGIIANTFMALAFKIAWALDPLVFGDYPIQMRNIVGSQLPRFSSNEKSLIKGSLDFIGLNHYTTFYVKDCFSSACSLGGDHAIGGFLETTGFRDGIPIGASTGIPGFFVVPRGMEKTVDYIKTRYHNMPLFITKNGYSAPPKQDAASHDFLQDFDRVKFHNAYLAALLRAIGKGADVRGYFMWSLMDNFEWIHGYGTGFGTFQISEEYRRKLLPIIPISLK
ncbi:hypothetical protein K1719_027201 [Acacia pycnantha]|nr:hypothetical protein K1719_027201 [Acacia pycnantha]